jgi:Acyl-coenzyme A:6-aminopenicillanic acid acyl-transferase
LWQALAAHHDYRRLSMSHTLKSKIGLLIASCGCVFAPVQACTIFVLTDTNRVLFSNNEDSPDPQTRISFVPADDGPSSDSRRYGCVYVGYENGWAQGGMNSEGLAFDWVAGYKERWERDTKMNSTTGNPAERMLESCATVEEAVHFFQTHWEPSFSYARILIADRTGASVTIRARNGRLDAHIMKQSCGFGYSDAILDKMLAENSTPTLTNAANILRAAKQEGRNATKYSNVFDLKSGDIFLFRFPERPQAVKLNLAEELKKGRHFYDIPKIRDELVRESKSAPSNTALKPTAVAP